MAAKDRLRRSFVYKGFQAVLIREYGEDTAQSLWQSANSELAAIEAAFPDASRDDRMMVYPAAALCKTLTAHDPERALPLLRQYGTQTGKRIARLIHAVTCIPFVPELLWKHMPALMRATSSPEKGYSRFIVSETNELVGVDILACPLHDTAVRLGVPEAATIVCAMDKAYMSGFRRIRYTRTTSVAEGGSCCDYRLSYDKAKK